MQTVAEDGLNGVVARVGFLDVLHEVFISLTREFAAPTRLGVQAQGHVGLQLPLRVEFLAAVVALKAKAGVMGALVCAQVGFTREGFITVGTFERFLTTVPSQVVLKDILPLEFFAAYRTSEERFGSLVAVL